MWTKLDDNFPDHEKVMEAGPLASWLYVCGLCYSNRLLTDGFIPAGQLRKLADVKNAPTLASTLVHVGLWEQVEGGYKIHDYHSYNMTAEEAKAKRAEISEKRAEAGRKGMSSRWGASNKEDNKHNKPDNNGSRDMLSTVDNKTITPSHPVNSNTKERESTEQKGEVNTTSAQRVEKDNFTEFAEEFWRTYPARDGVKRKKKECFTELRKLGSRDWDDCLLAAQRYSERREARDGYAPDAFRWLRDDWKQYLTAPIQEQGNGNNGLSRKDAGFKDYFAAARAEYEQGESDSPPGSDRLYLSSGQSAPTVRPGDNGDGPQGMVPRPARHPH
jgi:hypothetical protein